MKKANSAELTPPNNEIKKWQILLVIFAMIIPVVSLGVLMLKYGVKFPFWDQWELVPYIEKLKNGSLTIFNLWEQHNEHRIFLPRTFMLLVASITHWSNLAEIFSNLAIACCSLSLIILMLRRNMRGMKFFYFLIVSMLIGWIFLSSGQWENWLWGWQIQWFMSVFGVVLCMWSLTSWPARLDQRWSFVVAVLGAIIANYSLGNGLVAWPAGLLVLLLTKTTWRKRIGWIIIGGLTIGLYYYNYYDPNPGEKTLFIKNMGLFFQYVLTYLGSTMSIPWGYQGKMIFGGVLLTVFLISFSYLWLRHRSRLSDYAGWSGLAAYGLISAVLAGVARLDLGVAQAASSRYTTVSVLFLLGTLALTGGALQSLYVSTRKLRVMVVIISVVLGSGLAVGEVLTYSRGITLMNELKQNLSETNHCIHAAESSSPECLAKAYPDKEIVWQRIQYLRTIHWAGF